MELEVKAELCASPPSALIISLIMRAAGKRLCTPSYFTQITLQLFACLHPSVPTASHLGSQCCDWLDTSTLLRFSRTFMRINSQKDDLFSSASTSTLARGRRWILVAEQLKTNKTPMSSVVRVLRQIIVGIRCRPDSEVWLPAVTAEISTCNDISDQLRMIVVYCQSGSGWILMGFSDDNKNNNNNDNNN